MKEGEFYPTKTQKTTEEDWEDRGGSAPDQTGSNYSRKKFEQAGGGAVEPITPNTRSKVTRHVIHSFNLIK